MKMGGVNLALWIKEFGYNEQTMIIRDRVAHKEMLCCFNISTGFSAKS